MRSMSYCRWFLVALAFWAARAPAADPPVLSLHFAQDQPAVRLVNGTKRTDGALEFTNALQYAEVGCSGKLDGIKAITVGAWVYPKRSGEQSFVFRGIPEVGPNGERMFRPNDHWVNFVLGTDQHGFFLATADGNGSMPFPHVTLNDVPIDAWSQLVYVKDEHGIQTFYVNGTAIHSDKDSAHAGKRFPFHDTAPGEPVRLSVPLGGRIGEAWVYGRARSAEEIARDFAAKKARYKPALPARPVALREMDAHPAAGLWDDRGGPVTKETWPKHRERILRGVAEVLGPMPKDKVPLDPKVLGEEDCGSYVRRKVSIQVQPGDRMPAYLLVPKKRHGRVPAIVCFYGTTSGAGKDTTVGLSGGKPGTPPERNRAFAIDMVEAGFAAFAADYLRDGERIRPGRRPYDTTDFYQEFPDWSVHGKDAWDTMRAIDYLQTLDFVDPDRIGMVGHSYGGHSTIFTTALEPRIKAAWANGPVSDFRHHGLHWAVPKGGANSQSMPALRPYVLDHTLRIPVTFYEWTALIAPRPLAVGQAVGERRPMEEENYAAVSEVYRALGAGERVKYVWYPGDHDFPPAARRAAVDWFRKWLGP
jgi:dienelactone hydrolase